MAGIPLRIVNLEGCVLPEDRLYDIENDVWVGPDPEAGVYRLGILATFSAFAGRIQSVTFRPMDGLLARGRSVGTVESVRLTGPVCTPVDVTVLEQNRMVVERPKLLNDSPYDAGWLVRLRPADPDALGKTLEPATAVAERLRERIRSLRIRCFAAMPDSELFEIGLECSAVLVKLDEELARRAPGEVVLLVTDDPTSRIELARWSDQTGYPIIDYRREGTLNEFLVRREADPTPRKPRR